ncbi:MAG: cbb3-type cytochrome c oxidase subunit II [Bdellovibrionaceae bacterium]|nr:cbb3-type cytochrome c oxidase subunit II [Pseudobdellovibrionaceae bacterium]
MNKAYIFVFGGTSTITLSIFLFVLLPRLQLIPIDREAISAQAPYSADELMGRQVYVAQGCVYCHTQQVRDPIAGADKHFGWGRASIASDYIYDKPHLLGTMRTGPDLSNIGSRQPSYDWQHLHLYNPRILVQWSIMPGFPFLYKVLKSPNRPQMKAIAVPGEEGTWILPTPEAENLVEYLMSLKRDRDPFKASEE